MKKPCLTDLPEYYRRYIEKVIDKDILQYFSEQKNYVIDFFTSIGEEKSQSRYAENKWSIKQILGHLCDSERVFITRALKFARNEKQPLPGFDENDYVNSANFDELSLDILVDDFKKMRDSHISLFKTFNDEILDRKGIANNTEYSVSSVLFIMAGHVDHHIKVIKEKYLA
ncbi:MAG TPA: DinB family protein [Ignavibacteria bacterium]|nr:DinB family protein [Ignavibacteria bacterium]